MLEREALSVVNEMLVLVMVQVSATAKLPPRLRVVFEVLNEAPLANVAPIGRSRVPPVEERVPAVALIPPLRDKSAAPVTSFSPAASMVNGSLTISGIEMVSADPLRSSEPIPVEAEFPRVAAACRIRRVSLSVTVPDRFKSPPNFSSPPERSNSCVLREMVVPVPVLNVPVIAKSFSNSKAVPGTVSSELLSTVPPSVNVPPEEFSDALSVNAYAPERLSLPAPVSRSIPDKVRLSFTFR